MRSLVDFWPEPLFDRTHLAFGSHDSYPTRNEATINETIKTLFLKEIFSLIGLPYREPDHGNDLPVSFSPIVMQGMIDPTLLT
jgi:hypothetical protein